MRKIILVLLIVAAAASGLAAQDFMARAKALHKQAPLIDGHNDYPWALRENNIERDINKLDIAKPQPSIMTDVARLRAGGVGGQFWSVYVPASMQGQTAVRATSHSARAFECEKITGACETRIASAIVSADT